MRKITHFHLTVFGLGLSGLLLPGFSSAQTGIGTFTPDATVALHVKSSASNTSGPIRLEGLGAGTTETLVVVTDALGVLRYRSASALMPNNDLWVNVANVISPVSNRAVAIGQTTAEPSSVLSVNGTSTVVGASRVQFRDVDNAIYSASADDWRFVGRTEVNFRNRANTQNVLTVQAQTARVGIGTNVPQQTLHVAGTMRITAFVGLPDLLNDYVLVTNAAGDVRRAQLSALYGYTGDDLGDHIATQNVELNGNWLSNNGTATGIRVDNGGRVGIGVANPGADLHVGGTVRTPGIATVTDDDYLITSDNGGNLRRITKANAILAFGDNLGNHTATQAVNLNGNWLSNNGTATGIRVDNGGRVGIGVANPGADLHVGGTVRTPGIAAVTDDAFLVTSDGGGNLRRIAKADAILAFGDHLGNHTATQNVRLSNNWLSNDGTAAGIRVDNGGRVGIGVANPGADLHVGGTVRTPGIATVTDDAFLVTSDGGGNLRRIAKANAAAIFGDHLGNHTATQNVRLNGNWLSNDGTATGIRVDNGGRVGIGVANPGADLHVGGTVRTPGIAAVTDDAFLVTSDGGGNLRRIAKADAILAFGDHLGNHTATQNVRLSNNWLSNDGTATGIRVDNGGRVGIGVANPGADLHVGGTVRTPGIAAVTDDAFLVTSDGGGNLRRIAKADAILAFGDHLGNHTATQNVRLNGNWLSNDGTATGIRVDNGGRVGIGVANPGADLHVGGTVRTPGIATVTDDAFLVTSDGGGNLRRIAKANAAAIFGDHLGNHTATQNVRLSNNWLSNNGTATGIRVDNGGRVGIGVANPGADLHVGGTVRTPGIAAVTDDAFLVTSDGGGNLRRIAKADAILAFGDHLGNHTATQNVRLSNNWLSNDGTATGIRVDNGGRVGIGVANPGADLHVGGTVRTPGIAAVTDDAFLVTSDGGGNLRRIAKADAILAFGDHLGNHTATQNVRLSNNWLSNDGTATGIRVDNGGRVGIGVANPGADLHVGGTVRTPGIATVTDDAFLVTSDGGGNLRRIAKATAIGLLGDHLGNHTATQNVRLNGNWLSNDGTATGIRVDNGGRVGIGVANPGADLHVGGTVRTPGIAAVTDDAFLVTSDGGGNLRRIAKADAILAFGDHLGNHTATQNVRLSNNWLSNDGTATGIRVDNGGRVGIGVANPGADLHVGGSVRTPGIAAVTDDAFLVTSDGGGNLRRIAKADAILAFGDHLGNHTATQNVRLSNNWLSNDGTATGIRVDNGGQVGIGVAVPTAGFHVGGTVRTPGIATVTDDAFVITSDAGGMLRRITKATAISLLGDNLGNHTATQNVRLNGNWLSNDGTATGIRVDNGGNIGIGVAAPSSRLHVVQNVGGTDASLLLQQSTLNESAGISLIEGSTAQDFGFSIRYDGLGNQLNIGRFNGGTHLNIDRNSGNLALGMGNTVSASNRLLVNGSARITGTNFLYFGNAPNVNVYTGRSPGGGGVDDFEIVNEEGDVHVHSRSTRITGTVAGGALPVAAFNGVTQRIGLGTQINPQSTVHITPRNGTDHPLRVDNMPTAPDFGNVYKILMINDAGQIFKSTLYTDENPKFNGGGGGPQSAKSQIDDDSSLSRDDAFGQLMLENQELKARQAELTSRLESLTEIVEQLREQTTRMLNPSAEAQ